MASIPNYMVIDTTNGQLVYTDSGAAVEATFDEAQQTADFIANWMNWERNRLAVKKVELNEPE